eukprot:c8629_g1_i1.p1 GENE.c8629_g1_i1~~c8629_g1_i1.p1  ORF type:complete len:287 (+),score=48.63 c8629_g1_i1:54-914(+)
MNSQAESAGFKNALVSKGVILLTTFTSITCFLSEIRRYFVYTPGSTAIWRLLASQLTFSHPGSMFMTLMLLYRFRTLERIMGSRKFASFLCFSASSWVLLCLGLQKVSGPTFAPGPFAIVFPALYQYIVITPIPGPKLMTSIMSINLFFTSPSLAMLGLLCGALYDWDPTHLSKRSLPSPIVSFANRFLRPLLTGPEAANRRFYVPRPAERGGAGQNYSEQLIGGTGARLVRPVPAAVVPPAAYQPREEDIANLTQLGFEREQVVQALIRTRGDVHAASNSLLDMH